jgi:hypothetical protein
MARHACEKCEQARDTDYRMLFYLCFAGGMAIFTIGGLSLLGLSAIVANHIAVLLSVSLMLSSSSAIGVLLLMLKDRVY